MPSGRRLDGCHHRFMISGGGCVRGILYAQDRYERSE